MKKYIIIILVVLTSGFSLKAQNLTAREIVDRAVVAIKLKGSESISTLTIIDKRGRTRVRKMTQASKLFDNGNTEKTIIKFMEPADVKGTGLLTYDYKEKDDDMWLYMPALRKTRRIVSSEKSKSFMGSEFSYSDLTPPNMDNYIFKLFPDEIINGELCYKVEMSPKNQDIADENAFSKKISWFGKNDFVIRKSVYYDLFGEKEKELISKSIKELDKDNKKFRPMEMIMINLQNDRKSIMKIDNIIFNPNVKNEYFETSFLEK
ncbi:outer membrane lipoprotein-sorting protein [Bacteroidota bacterium]